MKTLWWVFAKHCWTSLPSHLQLRCCILRKEVESPWQVDVVSCSHVTSKRGVPLGRQGRRVHFWDRRQLAGKPRNSHTVFSRRKFRLSLCLARWVCCCYSCLRDQKSPRRTQRSCDGMPEQKSNGIKPCRMERHLQGCPGFKNCSRKFLFWELGFGNPGWQLCLLRVLAVSLLYPNMGLSAFL